MMTEGREVNPDWVTPHVVHPGLHHDYDLDFRMQRVDDIAPTLTSPMLSGLVSSIYLTGRPVVPGGPASPKTEEGLWGHGGAPARPDAPGPSHIGGPVETEGDKLLEQGGIDLDATIPAPTLTSPMLSGLVSSICLTGRPVVPGGPASPKTEEGLWGHGGAPAQPDAPGPSHIGGPVETEGDKLLEQGGIDLDATIPAFTSEDAAAVIISDDEVTSFPGGWPEAISTPKIELAWGQKRPSEDRSPRSSPPKKRATEEMAESPPPCEAALLRGMSEKDILPKRYEVFTSDYNWVQSVRGSLLGLEAGASPSRRDIDNSSRFVP